MENKIPSINDDEIIKAVECCADDSANSCDNCPFEMECYADGLNLNKLTLELINRKNAKIDELTEKLNATIAGQETLQKALDKEVKRREIQADRLKEERNQKYKQADMLCKLRNELAEKNAEIEGFNQIETTINAFWCELQKLSLVKGKETPTLEELLEYIEQVKAETVKEFVDKISQLLERYSCVHKHADEARNNTDEYPDGTTSEMTSVWEVQSLTKHGMANYETMTELQKNIEYIAQDRLLSGLEKDFRLLIREMVDAENATTTETVGEKT